MVDHNVIPRKFTKIICKNLVGCGDLKVGDVCEVWRDECNGLLLLNTRTNKQYATFINHIRNKEITEIIEII